MKLLQVDSTDPYLNLAIEEYLVNTTKYSSPIIYLWQNDNTIVVGKNQNTISEIKVLEVEKDNLKVIRRNSGGGTVFHDLGNLCFSVIVDNDQNLSINDAFKKYLEPIVNLLKNLGLNVALKGRNDLVIEDKKISGNAQWQTKDKILSHGTILFNTDLTKLQKYLNVNLLKLNSKKIKSVSSRVTNISPLLPNISIEEFKDLVWKAYSKNQISEVLELDLEDWNSIKQLRDNKFKSWDWNYGKNETCDFTNEAYWPDVGLIQVQLWIVEGIISQLKIYGDFFGLVDCQELIKLLNGQIYSAETIKKKIAEIDLTKIFGEKFTEDKFLRLLFE